MEIQQAKQHCDGYEDQLVKEKQKKNELKAKLKARPTSTQMAHSMTGNFSSDQAYVAYVNLKFKEWQPKMTCATCKDRENEVILPCGHMYCHDCMN